jgi:predicted ATPase
VPQIDVAVFAQSHTTISDPWAYRRKVMLMETKTKTQTRKEAPEENQKDREHRLKDAFNAMGYVNLAIAK